MIIHRPSPMDLRAKPAALLNSSWTSLLAILALSFMLALPGLGQASAQSWSGNGCIGELAGRWDVVCPVSPDSAEYIQYVRVWSGGVSIALTGEGIMHGLACDGAASLVLMASQEYARLPADQRAYDDLLWADPYITSEVMGHAVAAASGIPSLVKHGNPIDVVFADYWTPGSQGMFWRSFDDPTKPFAPGACAGNT